MYMADLPLYPDSNRDAGEESASTPRWVKLFGVIALVAFLLFVILHLTGGGPGSHSP
jgi:hypothetical protein